MLSFLSHIRARRKIEEAACRAPVGIQALVLSLFALGGGLLALAASGFFGGTVRDALPSAGNIGWIRDGFRGARLDGRGVRVLLETAGPLCLVFPLFLVLVRRRTDPPKAFRSAFLVAVVLAGALLRVHLWAEKSFWRDSYALKAALRNHSFRELLTEPLGFEQSAPIGFCLLGKSVGELSGWNDRCLTLPLLLVGIAVLVLFPLCLQRAGISRFRGAATLLLALSPHLVFYSAEFKPYGIDALFALLSLLVAVEFGRGRTNRPLLLSVFVLGPFFSHTQFFLLPGLGLAFLLKTFRAGGRWARPSRRDFQFFLVCAISGGTATLVSYFHTVAAMPDLMFDFWAEAFPPLESARAYLAWWADKGLRFFHDPFLVLPVPGVVSWRGLAFSLPVSAILLLGAVNRRNRPVFVFVSVSLVLLVIACSLRKWPVFPGRDSVVVSRLLLFLLPLAFFLLGCGLERLSRLSLPLAAAMAVCGAFFGFLRLLQLDDRKHSFSWPDAVDELVRRSDDASPIMLGTGHAFVAWAYRPEWTGANQDRICTLDLDDPAPFAARLDQLAASPPPEGFWILWSDRPREGKMVPELCRDHLAGLHADFVKKTRAGNLQHFPGRRKSQHNP